MLLILPLLRLALPTILFTGLVLLPLVSLALPTVLTPACNSGDGTYTTNNGVYTLTGNYLYFQAPAGVPSTVYVEVRFKFAGSNNIPNFDLQYTGRPPPTSPPAL